MERRAYPSMPISTGSTARMRSPDEPPLRPPDLTNFWASLPQATCLLGAASLQRTEEFSRRFRELFIGIYAAFRGFTTFRCEKGMDTILLLTRRAVCAKGTDDHRGAGWRRNARTRGQCRTTYPAPRAAVGRCAAPAGFG